MKFRRLYASEIDARVSTVNEKGCSLLLYKDARVDQNLLDETVGAMNWQRSHQLIGDRLYCTVSIWDDQKKQWISKQDVGTESFTEPEKGQASDSFKRACFNFGIGRELYTAPFIWIPANSVSLEKKNGKLTTYDKFRVRDISYNKDGEIVNLTIVNDSRNGEVVYKLFAKGAELTKSDYKSEEPKSEQQDEEKPIEDVERRKIDDIKIDALIKRCDTSGIRPELIAQAYMVNDIKDLNEAQYASIHDQWDKIVKWAKGKGAKSARI